jgi:hypothetical protein
LDIAIFLSDYHTTIDAGPYGIRDCAQEVFSRLNIIDSQNHRPPMDKKKITFVCPSLGGIVTRYLLAEKYGLYVCLGPRVQAIEGQTQCDSV